VKFIEPKNRNAKPVDWKISKKTQDIIKYYAEYTEYSEEEVVDEFLLNILGDQKFIDWINTKKNNKRILKDLGLSDNEQTEKAI
jgi:hypothetical protein